MKLINIFNNHLETCNNAIENILTSKSVSSDNYVCQSVFTPNETKYNSDSIFGANLTPKLSLVAVIRHNLQNWKIFPCL